MFSWGICGVSCILPCGEAMGRMTPLGGEAAARAWGVSAGRVWGSGAQYSHHCAGGLV